GLRELARLSNLVTLNLAKTKVTDAGLKEVLRFKRLAVLDLSGTQVTDLGLKDIAAIKSLTSLRLDGSKVTDAGLKELSGLKHLVTISLGKSQMTDASLRWLRERDLLHGLSEARGKDGKRPTSLEDVFSLDFSLARLTDAGLKELAGCKNLVELDLS